MWQLLKDYFSFTKKERKGIFYFVLILTALIILPHFFSLFTRDEIMDSSGFEKEIAQLSPDSSSQKTYSGNNSEYSDDYSPSYKKEETPIKKELFYFDPNTASESDWIRLGIRKKTAQTIQNYIAKGGKFYKPRDIKKIYGLSEKDAERLIPYVSIATSNKEFPGEKQYPAKGISHSKYSLRPFDINTADTADLLALPGIGSVLSKRIISFRQKLGGFYSVDQVAETYNLPDSTFEKIKKYLLIDAKAIKKININAATLDEMRSHPYISYNIAKVIFQYRQQHGNFNSVEELRKIMTISDEFINKTAPYLSIE